MRSVALVQGSPEWHEFRRQGVGGSDAPVVEGNSPYRTLRQLALEKRGLMAEESEDNEFIFSKGHRTESLIRKQFQDLTGVEMNPLCAIHDKFDHVRASLDGFDPVKFGVLEGKLIGQDVLERARSAKRMKISERIPAHHYTQIQHQLSVTGVDLAHWFGHDGKGQGVLLEIKADRKYMKALLEKEHRFWEMVQKGELPPLSDQDYLVPDNVALLAELRDAKELMENAAIAYEMMKQKVIQTYNHPKIAGAGVKVYRVTRQGSLSLSSHPEVQATVQKIQKKLKPEELEQFRGKGSVSWTVSIDKPKKEGK
jgi:putative phage-type endonuclease